MNDFVTFYYPPDRQGETLYVELAAPSSTSKAVLYSSGPLQTSLGLKSHRFGDAESYRRALSGAAEILKKQGGLLLEWSNSRYRAGLFPASAYKPPSSLLVLSLAGEPRIVAVESGPEAVREPSHKLVVPVDQTAEKHLQAWLHQVSGFPDDVQTVLFNSLRRPALEARLSRLEDRAAEKAAGRNAASASDPKKPRSSWLQPWIAAPALVALIFLVAVIGIYSANWGLPGFSPVPFRSASSDVEPQQQGEAPTVQQPTGPEAASGETGGTGEAGAEEEGQPPQPPPPPPVLSIPDPHLREPLGQFLSAWAAAGEATAAGKLYRSHMAPALEAHPDDLESALKEEGAVWGLAKLHGLAAGLTFSETVLTRPDYRSALKMGLRAPGVPQALQPTFAYFGCLAFGQPGLKEYPGDDDAAALLVEGADCSSIDRQGAQAALDQLTQFVRTQSGQ